MHCYHENSLTVITLDSGSSGPVSRPGRGHFVVPLSTQEYKWVPQKKNAGGNLQWSSIPSRGSSNTRSPFMLQKPGKASAVIIIIIINIYIAQISYHDQMRLWITS